MQGPERYLNEIGVTLDAYDDPSRPAVLDEGHRAIVNHEVYFFSTTAARDAFLADPVKTCGLVTDPVSTKRFRPTSGSPHVDYAGRVYFFESAVDKRKFLVSPDRYKDPMRTMPKM